MSEDTTQKTTDWVQFAEDNLFRRDCPEELTMSVEGEDKGDGLVLLKFTFVLNLIRYNDVIRSFPSVHITALDEVAHVEKSLDHVWSETMLAIGKALSAKGWLAEGPWND